MLTWRKIAHVMRREYLVNFRRPAFLFTAFGVPLISFAAMFLIVQFTASRETNLDDFQRVAYINRAGISLDGDYNPGDYQPVVDDTLAVPGDTADAAAKTAYFDALHESASRQLVDNEIDAFFVIPDLYVLTGSVDLYARKNVPAALHSDIEDFMRQQIAAQAPGDLPVSTERLGGEVEVTIRDINTGEELSDSALMGRVMLPFVFVMIYFMATNSTAQFFMSGVVDEKENRLMEILATSLRPIELLWGKLLGLGALAITQVVFWAIAGAAIAMINKDAQEFLSGAAFQPADIALVITMFLANFFLFSAMMLGIGASVTAEAESRQVAGFFTFINVLPLMLSVMFITNPNGTLPVVFSFFPLTAAVAMLMRFGFTSVPAWQIALSLMIQVMSVVVTVWLAAKVFRLGMLMYGKPLTPRTVWRALREGHTVLTSAKENGVQVTKKPTRTRKWGILGR
ncbi:MAG: ABC transporter permease [Anaerolineae bacterium]|nr:ABC transporter permease [Anaerolineae bacterium]